MSAHAFPASSDELKSDLDYLLSAAATLAVVFPVPSLTRGIAVLRAIVDDTDTVSYLWDLFTAKGLHRA